jgi:hypothetical protein
MQKWEYLVIAPMGGHLVPNRFGGIWKLTPQGVEEVVDFQALKNDLPEGTTIPGAFAKLVAQFAEQGWDWRVY